MGIKKKDTITLNPHDSAFIMRKDGTMDFAFPNVDMIPDDVVSYGEKLMVTIAILLSKEDGEFLDLVESKWEEMVVEASGSTVH